MLRTEVPSKAPDTRAPDTQVADTQGAVRVCADPVARQVRAAGGPLDRATYSCQCGYVFAAAVTTTVSCPHCGESQAW